MKLIKLINGSFCQVSDGDYGFLNEIQWTTKKSNSNKRQVEYVVSKSVLMHRLIMGCKKGDGLKVDHIDGNGLNNQRYNLRVCLHSDNMSNRIKMNLNCTSKFLGVWKRKKKKKKWAAEICKNSKRVFREYFYTENEAALAYNEKAKLIHGEFCKLNEV